jgi:diguanylate cyclase (GGDEF)-like protein
MISLKTYLLGNNEHDTDAYRHVIDIMLQGIALHTVPGRKADYERFRGDIDRLGTTLTADTKPAELLVTAGELIRTLEEYSRTTTAYIERQSSELQKMVTMLTETVIKIGSNSDASVAKLREIEKALAQARMVEDIKLLKVRLEECLETVHAEAERQKVEGQTAIAKLEQELNASRESVGSGARPKEADPVTGLPNKSEAEKALRSAVSSPDGIYLVVVVVNRVSAVNARFGYAAGDRILVRCAEHFRSGLSKSDQLYRWQGPAFLCVLSRNTRIDEVRSEIRRFADAHLEETIEVGKRSVMIPVSSNWSVLPPAASFDALQKKIEAFTAAQTPREYA